MSSGSLTFTAGHLLIAIVDNGNNKTVTQGTNFTFDYNTTAGAGAGEAASTEYWLSGSGSPAPATFTFGAASSWVCSAAAFKATAAASHLLIRPFPGLPTAFLSS